MDVDSPFHAGLRAFQVRIRDFSPPTLRLARRLINRRLKANDTEDGTMTAIRMNYQRIAAKVSFITLPRIYLVAILTSLLIAVIR
jgi:hypothetical protein